MIYSYECDIPKGAICPFGTRIKEFISYRNEATRSYIAFEKNENISHEQSEYITKNFLPNLTI